MDFQYLQNKFRDNIFRDYLLTILFIIVGGDLIQIAQNTRYIKCLIIIVVVSKVIMFLKKRSKQYEQINKKLIFEHIVMISLSFNQIVGSLWKIYTINSFDFFEMVIVITCVAIEGFIVLKEE